MPPTAAVDGPIGAIASSSTTSGSSTRWTSVQKRVLGSRLQDGLADDVVQELLELLDVEDDRPGRGGRCGGPL